MESGERSSAQVVDTSRSPHCRLKPIPVEAVRLGEGFWKPRLEANRKAGIPTLYRLLKEHGVVDNFLRLSGKEVARQGPVFTDSDLYKWMEAAAWALLQEEDAEIRGLLEETIDAVLGAQGKDGYLNTWFVEERAAQRFTRLGSDHELYCAGHFFQAAIAHYRASRQGGLLEATVRFADYMCEVFGPDKLRDCDGHPEVEMALVELYRQTGETRYLDLAGFFLEERNFSSLQELEGHAVRACYFCCGGADYYAETGNESVLASLERQWDSLTRSKMYITGGVGGRPEGEAVGNAFELPNDRSYAETCAAIGSIFWNWRMLALKGEARFADLLERTLYNGFLSGVSLSGTEYFYANPLADSGKGEGHPWARKRPRGRTQWYVCTCCPTNAVRMLASLPGYFFSASEEGLWVHLYDDCTLQWRLPDGTPLTLTQQTRYPWEGKVEILLSLPGEKKFSLFLRIPEWCERATVKVNGATVQEVPRGGTYLQLERTWKSQDKVLLEMDMPPALMACDTRVEGTRDSVALQRGPLVYCLEEADHPGIDVRLVRLVHDPTDPSGGFRAEYREGMLGGITVLLGQGAVPVDPGNLGPLYRPANRAQEVKRRPVSLQAIPYYAWANRGPGSMTVWMQK